MEVGTNVRWPVAVSFAVSVALNGFQMTSFASVTAVIYRSYEGVTKTMSTLLVLQSTLMFFLLNVPVSYLID